jgi:hypothetical protein
MKANRRFMGSTKNHEKLLENQTNQLKRKQILKNVSLVPQK